jgi:hypothetical protein
VLLAYLRSETHFRSRRRQLQRRGTHALRAAARVHAARAASARRKVPTRVDEAARARLPLLI